MRPVQQAEADVEPALHPARVLTCPVARTLGEPDQLEHLVRPPHEVSPAHAVQPAEEAQILSRVEVGIDGELLWYVTDAGLRGDATRRQRRTVENDLSGVGLEQAADHRDRRRLAGAVRAEQPVRLSEGDREADLADRLHRAEALRQPAAGEHRARIGF